MFYKIILDLPENLHSDLSQSCLFEDITNGRKGANLVDCVQNVIPIVRTTTNYVLPNQKFLPVHKMIIDKIKQSIIKSSICDEINPNIDFNNALIEMYNNKYCNMGFHSDQALDLDDDSYICIFSCYDNPKNPRKLHTKNKITNECSSITLDHNSIILFSTNTNSKYLHKIILENRELPSNWLGITYRKSKTFLKFESDIPFFLDTGKPLILANEDTKKEFYKFRSLENSNIEYAYPEINYTISGGDIKPII